MSTIKAPATTALIALLLQAQAFAVPVQSQQVVVGNSQAQGSFRAASTSADHQQYVTCGLTAELSAPTSNKAATEPHVSLSCSAADAGGKYYICSTQDPPEAWVRMVAQLTENSWITFSGDAQGHCQSLIAHGP